MRRIHLSLLAIIEGSAGSSNHRIPVIPSRRQRFGATPRGTGAEASLTCSFRLGSGRLPGAPSAETLTCV
ncbi:hypothetical protein [Streptomyces sp. NPDC002763]|uniref:hypothetical protein n=1 Tax=Streptomyces sp. NPDC002763 TaxID=3154427 RepID=UPI00332A96BF